MYRLLFLGEVTREEYYQVMLGLILIIVGLKLSTYFLNMSLKHDDKSKK